MVGTYLKTKRKIRKNITNEVVSSQVQQEVVKEDGSGSEWEIVGCGA